jgi:hypothetical protein
MYSDQHRYFIELQPGEDTIVPRWQETEMRRALAARFLEWISAWLKEQKLEKKVSTIVITALGQVLITCEADVIHQILLQGVMDIATIRQGVMFVGHAGRWNEAR